MSSRRPGRIVSAAIDAVTVAKVRALVSEHGQGGTVRLLAISPLQLDGILYGDLFLPGTVERLTAKIQEVTHAHG